jgi:sugar lactone lactonase YvrE
MSAVWVAGVPGRAALTAALAALTALAAGGGVSVAADRAGAQAAGMISTVAGGIGGPGAGAKIALFGAFGASFAGGTAYVADAEAVRALNMRTGHMTTPAGTGASDGPLGDGGPAASAQLTTFAATPDRSRNLVITDEQHARIRVAAASTGTFYGQAMTAGQIYTVAGSGKDGFSGDGGPATSAEIDDPSGIVVDGAGNLVVSDSHNDRIRVVAASTGSFYGQAMTAGDIYTVAGSAKSGFAGDGGPATKAELLFPAGVAVDAAGNLVFADVDNNRIRVVAASTGTFYGRAMTAGDIYTVAGDGAFGSTGDGGPARQATLATPNDVAVDATGNLVIADTGSPTGPAGNRIRVVAARTGTFYGQAMKAGDIYRVAGIGVPGFAGDHGPALSAELHDPEGVATDSAGNLLIADTSNIRLRVVAVSTGTFYGQAMTAGDIYTVGGTGKAGFSGDHGPVRAAEMSGPAGIAFDPAGNEVIDDSGNSRIRLAAARAGTFYGQQVRAGDIVTVAGNGLGGFSGDGGPATKATLGGKTLGLAVDGTGNILIADNGQNRIRMVADHTGTFYGQQTKADDMYTVAGNGGQGFSGDAGPATSAELNDPEKVAVDHAGNLVIADTHNFRVRVVAASTGTFYGQAMTAGTIYTVAGNGSDIGTLSDGGLAIKSPLSFPAAVTVDATGNLVIGDVGDTEVEVVAVKAGTFYQRVMKAGHIYRVAGNLRLGFSGDGGPATSAELDGPSAIAVDHAGNLVIADEFNYRIRVVAVVSGTFYGQAMKAGNIYTVAGDGAFGFGGDGGPATSAELDQPQDVTVTRDGDLLIADGLNQRIRMVTG